MEELERLTGKPVVSGSQAIVWQVCELAGLQRQDGRGGALFDHRLRELID